MVTATCPNCRNPITYLETDPVARCRSCQRSFEVLSKAAAAPTIPPPLPTAIAILDDEDAVENDGDDDSEETPKPPSRNHYLNALEKYSDWGGRARRKEFFWFVAPNYLVMAFLIGSLTNPIFVGLFEVFIILPMFAVLARRFHDIGKSGYWALLMLPVWLVAIATNFLQRPDLYELYQMVHGFSCLIGIVMLVILWRPGIPGTNEYGPNPAEQVP